MGWRGDDVGVLVGFWGFEGWCVLWYCRIEEKREMGKKGIAHVESIGTRNKYNTQKASTLRIGVDTRNYIQ